MIMSASIIYSGRLGMTINGKVGPREVGSWWEKMVWCVLGRAFFFFFFFEAGY
jgi:hypothetical protein